MMGGSMTRSGLVSNWVLLFGTVGACMAAGAEEVPELSEYAWGFPIEVDRDASFYSIELPLEVNQSVSDPDLRDAGVYNAVGVPVTRVFQQISDDVEEAEHLEQLPTLPLYANAQPSADDVRLLFERDGDRTRVEFDSDGMIQTNEDEQLTAYIVDTRQLENSIEALEFSWNPLDSGFIGRITIDGSDNLQDWSNVGSGAVADLRENEASIIQRRVKLRKTSHDYLRIRWEGMPEEWRLSRVQGSYVTGVTRIVRKSIMLEASGEDPEDGGRIFDLGGAPVVDQVRVVLTEANTIISATIYYWSTRNERWIRTASGSHYYIGRNDNVVMSDAIRTDKIRTRRIKVVVTSGKPSVAMQLEVGWRPDSLIFLAQGDAPFTLAAGRAADSEDSYPQQRIYGDRSIVSLAATGGRSATAKLGPRYPLGGADSLRITRLTNWRQVSLWIGLLLGVAFVGFMAIKVIRDLKAE